MCLSALAGKQFEYPIAFDIEEQASLQNADALCQAFCSALESAGYYAAIYTFKSALESCIGDDIKSRYDVFLSHVDVIESSYAGNYGLWQYSWKGSVSGIVGEASGLCVSGLSGDHQGFWAEWIFKKCNNCHRQAE